MPQRASRIDAMEMPSRMKDALKRHNAERTAAILAEHQAAQAAAAPSGTAQAKLRDVASLLPTELSLRRAHLVSGRLRYCHYLCDGFDDSGWGCGFRSVQTILSWLDPAPPPSIAECQAVLAAVQPAAYAGARGWIGVADAVVLLDHYQNAQTTVLELPNGQAMARHTPALAAHFEAGGGPAMIGGGGDVYSKTIVGVRLGVPSADPLDDELLVWDPHFVGADPATAAETGGAVAWRTVRELLRGSSFYNVALPRRGTAPPPTAPPEQAEPADGWAAAFEVVDAG